ncbi:FtsK-like domain-containing protein [Balamuthia mandrillaris]
MTRDKAQQAKGNEENDGTSCSKEEAFRRAARLVMFSKRTDEQKAFLLSLPDYETPEITLCEFWISEYKGTKQEDCDQPKALKLLGIKASGSNTSSDESQLREFLHEWIKEFPVDVPPHYHTRFLELLGKDKKSGGIVNEFKLLFLKNKKNTKNFIQATNSRVRAVTVASTEKAFSHSGSFPSHKTWKTKRKQQKETGRHSANNSLKNNRKDKLVREEVALTSSDDDFSEEQYAEFKRTSSFSRGLATGFSWEVQSTHSIAKDMTMLEWELFSAVEPREFLNHAWQKDDKQKRAPNICKLIDHFNHVSYWVATQILTKGNKDKASLLKRFIKIAFCCLNLGNFNTMMQILSALASSPIYRLEDAWKKLGTKPLTVYAQMQDTMDPNHNYRNYSSALQKRIAAQEPCIPYFGLYLRNFTFIDDANPKYNHDGTINNKLLQQRWNQIVEIKQLQNIPFNIVRNPLAVNFYRSLEYIEDQDILYALSTTAYPRRKNNSSSDGSRGKSSGGGGSKIRDKIRNGNTFGRSQNKKDSKKKEEVPTLFLNPLLNLKNTNSGAASSGAEEADTDSSYSPRTDAWEEEEGSLSTPRTPRTPSGRRSRRNSDADQVLLKERNKIMMLGSNNSSPSSSIRIKSSASSPSIRTAAEREIDPTTANKSEKEGSDVVDAEKREDDKELKRQLSKTALNQQKRRSVMVSLAWMNEGLVKQAQLAQDIIEAHAERMLTPRTPRTPGRRVSANLNSYSSSLNTIVHSNKTASSPPLTSTPPEEKEKEKEEKQEQDETVRPVASVLEEETSAKEKGKEKEDDASEETEDSNKQDDEEEEDEDDEEWALMQELAQQREEWLREEEAKAMLRAFSSDEQEEDEEAQSLRQQAKAKENDEDAIFHLEHPTSSAVEDQQTATSVPDAREESVL